MRGRSELPSRRREKESGDESPQSKASASIPHGDADLLGRHRGDRDQQRKREHARRNGAGRCQAGSREKPPRHPFRNSRRNARKKTGRGRTAVGLDVRVAWEPPPIACRRNPPCTRQSVRHPARTAYTHPPSARATAGRRGTRGNRFRYDTKCSAGAADPAAST